MGKYKHFFFFLISLNKYLILIKYNTNIWIKILTFVDGTTDNNLPDNNETPSHWGRGIKLYFK